MSSSLSRFWSSIVAALRRDGLQVDRHVDTVHTLTFGHSWLQAEIEEAFPTELTLLRHTFYNGCIC